MTDLRLREQLVHLRTCIGDLNYAWRLLKELSIETPCSSIIVGAAFRFALITYVRPYTRSHGDLDGYMLDERHVPADSLELHRRLLRERHTVQAHSDLTVREPKVHLYPGLRPMIVENVIHGLESWDDIPRIIRLIERTLEGLNEEERRVEDLLAEQHQASREEPGV